MVDTTLRCPQCGKALEMDEAHSCWRVREPHQTRATWVLADVDVGIAKMVEYLQTIPGVRTHASCQGTIGEGGPHPYPPQVMASWPPEAEQRIRAEFDVTQLGECWGYLHPRGADA